MFQGLTVDTKAYMNVHIAKLVREAEQLDGQNTTRVKSGDIERDVIGTFVNYTVDIDADEASAEEYDELYEVLSDPSMPFHTITAPYGQSIITFDAYVSKITDELMLVTDGMQRWGNMSLKIVAKKPLRT